MVRFTDTLFAILHMRPEGIMPETTADNQRRLSDDEISTAHILILERQNKIAPELGNSKAAYYQARDEVATTLGINGDVLASQIGRWMNRRARQKKGQGMAEMTNMSSQIVGVPNMTSAQSLYVDIVRHDDLVPSDDALLRATGVPQATYSAIRSRLRAEGYEFEQIGERGPWKIIKRPHDRPRYEWEGPTRSGRLTSPEVVYPSTLLPIEETGQEINHWQPITKPNAVLLKSGTPWCTLSKNGIAYISKLAREAMGDPPYYTLVWSLSRQAIGIQPLFELAVGAYAMRKRKGVHGSVISLRALMTQLNLSISQTYSHVSCQMENGILVIPWPEGRSVKMANEHGQNDWQKVAKGINNVHYSDARCTIGKHSLYINSKALELLGDPLHCILFYSRHRQAIGVQSSTDSGGYRIAPKQKRGNTGESISLALLSAQIGIQFKSVKAIPCHMEDGMLIIQLPTESA